VEVKDLKIGDWYVGKGCTDSEEAFEVVAIEKNGMARVRHRGKPESRRHCNTIWRTKAEQEALEKGPPS
jgi:hypothetical protein